MKGCVESILQDNTSAIPFCPRPSGPPPWETVATGKSGKNYHDEVGTAQILSIILMGCLGTISLFFGVFTNCTAIYQLRRLRNRLQLHNYMIVLYMWDNALLLTSWTWLCLPAVTETNERYSGHVMLNSLPYGLTLLHFTLTGVIWTNLLIAFERSTVVSRPWAGTAEQMAARLKKAVPLIVLASLIFNCPRFLELEIYRCCDIFQDKLATKASTRLFAVPGGWYFWLYTVFSRSILVTVTPVIATACLTVHAVRAAGKANRFSQTTGRSKTATERALHKAYRYTTFVAAKFVICHGICGVCDLVECIFVPRGTEHVNYFDILKDFSSILVMLHSATDSVFYIREKCFLWSDEFVSSESAQRVITVRYRRCASVPTPRERKPYGVHAPLPDGSRPSDQTILLSPRFTVI